MLSSAADTKKELVRIGKILQPHAEALGIDTIRIEGAEVGNQVIPELHIIFKDAQFADNYHRTFEELLEGMSDNEELIQVFEMRTVGLVLPDRPSYTFNFPACRYHGEPLPDPRN